MGNLLLRRDNKHQEFDYQQFLQMLKLVENEKGQKEAAYQQEINQFKCRIIHHNDKQIEGICINEQCKADNRRICYDCLIERVHENDLQYNQPQNADNLNKIIRHYQTYLNSQIDSLQYLLYFKKLKLTNEFNINLSCIQIRELDKIYNDIINMKQSMSQISIEGYIQQQNNTNIGIFDYLRYFYLELEKIQNSLDKYLNYEQDRRKQQNNNEKFAITDSDIKEFQTFKDSKPQIIVNIIETLKYKNKELCEHDQNFIFEAVEEIKTLGIYFFNKKQYENTIRCCEAQIKFNPNDISAYFNLGASLHKLQRYQEAIQMYERALQIDTKDPDIYYNLGLSLNNLNKFEDAIKMYDQAIALNPQYLIAYHNKGTSLTNLQRYSEAIQMYDKVIQIDPFDSESYFNKGNCLYQLQREQEAIQMYDFAIKLNPQYKSALKNKELCLRKLQRNDESNQTFKQEQELESQQ